MENIQGIFWYGDIDNYFLGHQFEEIYKTRIYAPYLENIKDAVVLDIGANVGVFSYYASKYAKQVYALEPALIHFNILNEMIKFNKLENVTPIKKALFFNEKDYPLWHNQNRTMYSLHQSVNDGKEKPEMVKSITLDKLFEENNIEHINLMKLDIEGSETEVISSKGFSKVSDKIDVVIGETHQWSGRHPNQLIEAFKTNGFIVNGIPNDAQIFVATKSSVIGKKV